MKLRIALWVMESALPSATGVKKTFRAMALGLAGCVIAGMLIAIFASVMLGGGVFALYDGGHITMAEAIIIAASLMIIMILLCFRYAVGQFNQAIDVVDGGGSMQSLSSLEKTFNDLLDGFVEGFSQGMPAEQKENPPDSGENAESFYPKKAA